MGYFPNDNDEYFDALYIKNTKELVSIFAQDLEVGYVIREEYDNEVKYLKITNVKTKGEYIVLTFDNNTIYDHLTAYNTIVCIRDRQQ
jgi:hypothetical protein